MYDWICYVNGKIIVTQYSKTKNTYLCTLVTMFLSPDQIAKSIIHLFSFIYFALDSLLLLMALHKLFFPKKHDWCLLYLPTCINEYFYKKCDIFLLSLSPQHGNFKAKFKFSAKNNWNLSIWVTKNCQAMATGFIIKKTQSNQNYWILFANFYISIFSILVVQLL